jgi:hypothetical protein
MTEKEQESGQDIANRVAAGDYDGSLGALLEAIQSRFDVGAAGMTWAIDFEDLQISESDLTIDEAFQIERMTNQTWATIDPVSSAADCRAILAVCMSERLGLTPDEAQTRLKSVKATDILRGIHKTEVSPAPLG